MRHKEITISVKDGHIVVQLGHGPYTFGDDMLDQVHAIARWIDPDVSLEGIEFRGYEYLLRTQSTIKARED